MGEKNRQLYDRLLKSGFTEYQIGTYDMFNDGLSNPDSNRKFYDNLISSGNVTIDQIGTYDTFLSNTYEERKKKEGILSSLSKGVRKVGDFLGVGSPQDTPVDTSQVISEPLSPQSDTLPPLDPQDGLDTADSIDDYLNSRSFTQSERDNPDFKNMFSPDGKLDVEAADIILNNIRVGTSVRQGKAMEIPAIKAWVDKYPFMAPLVNFEQAIGRGTNRIIFKTLGGAQKMFYKGLGSIMEVSPFPLIKEAGAKLKKQQDEELNVFQLWEDYIEKSFDENWPVAEQGDFFSKIVYALGGVVPIIWTMGVTPKTSISGISTQLATNLGAQGFFQTYEETGKIGEALKEGAKGTGEGLLIGALSYGGAKASQYVIKGLTSAGAAPRLAGTMGGVSNTAVMAGGGASHDVALQVIEASESGENFVWDKQRTVDAAALWTALTFNGIVKNAVDVYAQAPKVAVDFARGLKVEAEALREKAIELEVEASKEFNTEKQVETLLTADHFHKMTDLKSIDALMGKNSEMAIKVIKSDKNMSDKQKESMIQKINESKMNIDLSELAEAGDVLKKEAAEKPVKAETKETVSGKKIEVPEGAEIMQEGMIKPEVKEKRTKEAVEKGEKKPVVEADVDKEIKGAPEVGKAKETLEENKTRLEEINKESDDLTKKIEVEEDAAVKEQLRVEKQNLAKEQRSIERSIKKQEDAIKKPSTEEVVVEKQAEVSEEVREGDAKAPEKEVTEEGKQLAVFDVSGEPPKPPTTTKEIAEPSDGKPSGKKPMIDKVKDRIQGRIAIIEKVKKSPTRKKLLTKIAEETIDREYHIKRVFEKSNKEDAEVVVRDINLRHGASAAVAVAVKRAFSRVYGDPLLKGSAKQLSTGQQKLLAESADMIRTIEIEERRNKKRLEYIKEKGGESKEEIAAIKQEAEDLFPSIKHEGDITKEDAYEFLRSVESKDKKLLGLFGLKEKDVDLNLLKERVEEYWGVFKESLKEQYDSGIISKELYEKLRDEYPYYSPRLHAEYVDIIDGNGGISGLKELSGGSTGAKIMDMNMLMQDNIQRSRMASFNNRMLNSMARFAQKNPDNGFIRVAPSKQIELPTAEKGIKVYDPVMAEIAKEQSKTQYEDTPSTMVALDYYELGVKKRLWLDKVLHDALYTGDKYEMLNNRLSQIGTALGVPMLKAAATGYNPEFGPKNAVLDIMHSWVATSEYSWFIPKAAIEYSADIRTVWGDAMGRKGRYLDYINEGGGMEFLSDQGKFQSQKIGKGFSTAKANVREVGDILGYIGNSSEMVMRLAVRERALNNSIKQFLKDNDKAPSEKELKELQRDATAVARGYVDFSQGGNTAKSLNHLIPYFTAGIAVTATSARAIKKNPITWLAKVGQVMGLAGGIAMWNMGNYQGGDEELKEERRYAYLHHISPIRKGNEIVIMTNKYYEDSRGNKRWMYIHLPLDPFQHNLKTMSEDIVVKNFSGEAYKDYKLMNKSQAAALRATTRSVTDVAALPPVPKALVGYIANYDLFYKDEIWPGAEFAENKQQEFFKDYTPERFVKIGKATGLSPVRTQYMAKQMLTGSNLFVSAMGEAGDIIARKIDPEIHENDNKNIAMTLKNTPFVRRFIGLTNPYTMDAKMKNLEGDYNMYKDINNRKLDEILSSDMSDNEKDVAVDGLYESLLEIPNYNEASRVLSRYYNRISGSDVANHPLLYLTRYRDASVRAEAYFIKTMNMMPEQREEMDNSIVEILNMTSDPFWIRLEELREIDKQQEN